MRVTRRVARGLPIALLACMEEQRRTGRVTLQQPVPAVVDGKHVYVVDVSTRGVRLSHSGLFPQGAECGVAFEWEGKPIEFVALQRWTRLQGSSSKSRYQSGFEIASIDNSSNAALSTFIQWCAERAVGIPVAVPNATQSGSTPLYVRHELVHGVWRKVPTTDSHQPHNGFTVPSAESITQVDLLRAVYAADPSMRDVIRKIAKLSVEWRY
jgi:hypothetical protein